MIMSVLKNVLKGGRLHRNLQNTPLGGGGGEQDFNISKMPSTAGKEKKKKGRDDVDSSCTGVILSNQESHFLFRLKPFCGCLQKVPVNGNSTITAAKVKSLGLHTVMSSHYANNRSKRELVG